MIRTALFVLALMTVALPVRALELTMPPQTDQSVECEDPYPCGDEWPAGLEGPFGLKEVKTYRAGRRLALTVSYGEPLGEYSQISYTPIITVHSGGVAGSQLVLPLASGTLGGDTTRVDYPPRPFVPQRRS